MPLYQFSRVTLVHGTGVSMFPELRLRNNPAQDPRRCF